MARAFDEQGAQPAGDVLTEKCGVVALYAPDADVARLVYFGLYALQHRGQESAGIAVSAMQCGLLPLSQTSMRFVGHIGYHDYEGPAVDLDERERIVGDLGPHDALVMRNHGLLTCGATIQQAFNTMYQLELSCRSQVDAMAARTELVMPGENVLAHTAHLYQPGTRRPYGVLEWPAMLRVLEAEDRHSGYPPYWH